MPFTIKSCHWITFVGEASQFSRAKTRSKPRRGPDPVVRSPVQSPKSKAEGARRGKSNVHRPSRRPSATHLRGRTKVQQCVRFSRNQSEGWMGQSASQQTGQTEKQLSGRSAASGRKEGSQDTEKHSAGPPVAAKPWRMAKSLLDLSANRRFDILILARLRPLRAPLPLACDLRLAVATFSNLIWFANLATDLPCKCTGSRSCLAQWEAARRPVGEADADSAACRPMGPPAGSCWLGFRERWV